jgi:hypothetical protein
MANERDHCQNQQDVDKQAYGMQQQEACYPKDYQQYSDSKKHAVSLSGRELHPDRDRRRGDNGFTTAFTVG